jgi:hypothetical protein
MPLFLAYSTALQGQVLVSQGKANEGLRQIQEGLTSLDAMEVRLFRSAYLAYQVEGYAELGQVDVGLSLLAHALEFVDTQDERFYEAELYRLKGTLTLEARGWRLETSPSSSQASSLKSHRRWRRRRRGISSKPWRSHDASRPSPSNCAPQQAWRGCGSNKASNMKLTRCYPRSTAGSPKGMTPKTCKRRKQCWKN